MSDLVRVLLAATAAGIAVAAGVYVLVRPTVRLSGRLRPSTAVSRNILGSSMSALQWSSTSGVISHTTLGRLLGPPLTALASRVGSLVEATSEEQLAIKIRQAGLFTRTQVPQRVQEYRIRQFATAVAGAGGAAALGLVLARPTLMVLILASTGFVGGAAYWRSRIDRAIEERRSRMEIELYTINQQLSLRVRIGGGVITAVRQLIARGQGAVISELAEAMRMIQGGMPASQAFWRLAEMTPEPHAARMYQLLASSEERGSDLAHALLAMSEDIREDRREALRTLATKRRAAMLVPIVGLLAPIMILFVGAPLPWIVFRGLGG
ncbi:MAG: type II secretion system F family protein [Acidimicrobiia bacterium]